MPLDTSGFVEGLSMLDDYLSSLYSEMDTFMGQFDKEAKGYSQVAEADKKYRSMIDEYRSRLSASIEREGVDIKGIAESSSVLYQLIDPDIDVSKAIKGIYTNSKLGGVTLAPPLFKRGSDIISRYYIKPIQDAIGEAQAAQGAQQQKAA